MSGLRHYGLIIGSLMVVACGGAAETPKTPVADAKVANTAEQKKPADVAAKTDKPSEPAAPEVKPAPPKEKFALPNVEFTPAGEREKLTLGGKEISAEVCLLDTSVPEMKDEWFSKALRSMAAAPDGSLYVLDNAFKVRHYIPAAGDTCKLAIDMAFGDKGLLTFPSEVERLSVLDDGSIFAYSFTKSYLYKAGKVEPLDCRLTALNSDGKTGFEYFMGDARLVGDVTGGCAVTDWKYQGWDAPKPEKGKDPGKWSVLSMQQWDKDILVTMNLEGDHFLGIHSQDGKLKVKFGKNRDKDKNVKEGEDICWAADADKCSAGLCVLDSNCRMLSAWDPKNGSMIDSVPVDKLLGVFYPWPVALVPVKGVSYLAVSHKEKQPEDAPKDAIKMNLGMIFRIKGLN